MYPYTQARSLFDHVVENNVGAVETCLKGGDHWSWRELIRYEFKILEALQENHLAMKLVKNHIMTVSSLHVAALLGHTDIIVSLLDKDIPVDITVESGSTVLHMACFGGHINTVKALLDIYRADITKRDHYGWSPLHYCCLEGHLIVAQQLIKHGCDIIIRDQDGATAAWRAKHNGHEELAAYLCTLGDEEELLNIDEDALIETDNPIYAKVNTPSDKPLLRANSDLMSENNNDVLQKSNALLRRQSSPAGVSTLRSRPASDFVTTGERSGKQFNTLPSKSKLSDKKKIEIRHMIRNQLEAAFEEDDYEQPVNIHRASKQNKESNPLTDSMGMNTLTAIMKEEFLKYRDKMQRESRTSRSSYPYSNPIPFEEEEFDEPDDPYESLYESLAKIPDSPPPPPPGFVPPKMPAPPLPPRNPSQIRRNAERNSSGSDQSNRNSGGSDKSNGDSERNSSQPNGNAVKRPTSGLYNPANDPELTGSYRFKPIEPTSAALGAAMQRLPRILGNSWKQVAIALPMEDTPSKSKDRVKAIEAAHPGDITKQTAKALAEWRINKGTDADVDALILALRKCGLHDMISEVETVTQEFTA